MAKYKIIDAQKRSWVSPTGETKYFKICDLENDAGATITNVSVWGNYKNPVDSLRNGYEIDGDIDASGSGKKFVFPRSAGKSGMSPEMEERRSKRIAFLASTERALEVVSFMEEKPKTAEAMKKAITGWRDWFVGEVENYESKLK